MMNSVTYREQLYPLGHGYPLWRPTPSENLPTVYRADGMRIGDVGLLTDDGGFDYLWNIHHAHDHPINLRNNGQTRVPPGNYVPLPPLDESEPMDVRVHSQYHNPNTYIAASTFNVRRLSADMNLDPAIIGVLAGGGAAFEFSTTHDASAALALPLGARRTDAVRLGQYQKYAAKHAISWYRYVNTDLEIGALNGTLYLVTGTDKCSSWGATAVSRSGSTNDLSLTFTAASVASASVGFRNTWIESIGGSTRIGEEDTMNQCVFSRGFVISIRELLVRLPVKISTAVRPVQARGGVDHPWVSGSGKPFSSASSRPFESYGRPRGGNEELERAQDESGTFADIDMDESNVDVFPFPSYSVQKSPVALIGEDLLRNYAPEAEVALVHDDDYMLLATSAVSQGKDLHEIYDSGDNRSGCKVQVENGVCLFVADRDLNASHGKEKLWSLPQSSLHSMNYESYGLPRTAPPLDDLSKIPRPVPQKRRPDTNYECSVCGRTYRHSSSLHRHRNAAHRHPS